MSSIKIAVKLNFNLVQIHWFRLLLCFLLPICSSGEESADLRKSDPQKTVLILGDSLAAGYGLEPNQAFPALLQQKAHEAGLNYQVINGGLSGDTSAGGLRRIDWLLKRRIDILVLELGGNDGLRGIQPEATKTNLQGIIAKTLKKYPSAKIVIVGMQMPPSMGEDYISQFKEIFPKLARENHAALVPFLLEKVGGDPSLNQADRIHPNAEGQKVVADNVWRILKPLLLP